MMFVPYCWEKERAFDYRVYSLNLSGSKGDCLAMFTTRKAAMAYIDRLYGESWSKR